MATFPLSLVMLAGQMADEPPPRMISEDGQIAGAVMLAAVFSVGLLIFVWLLRQFLFICRPNELLVVSGKGHRTNTGETTTFTVVLSGAHFRIPFLQTVDRMDLRLIPIELSMPKALSAGGIPLDIHAIANVKISSDPRFVYNAVERFLGLPRETIW